FGSYIARPPDVSSTSSSPARTTMTVAPSTALARVVPTVSFIDCLLADHGAAAPHCTNRIYQLTDSPSRATVTGRSTPDPASPRKPAHPPGRPLTRRPASSEHPALPSPRPSSSPPTAGRSPWSRRQPADR